MTIGELTPEGRNSIERLNNLKDHYLSRYNNGEIPESMMEYLGFIDACIEAVENDKPFPEHDCVYTQGESCEVCSLLPDYIDNERDL